VKWLPAATGLTPRLNDIKYFYKPALQYWATAAAFTVFGEHHWTARLWPALTGFLGVLAPDSPPPAVRPPGGLDCRRGTGAASCGT
jgi:hypothetical protein